MTIRLAAAADVAEIHAMLTELAAFENGTVRATPDDLLRDGFGDRPLFEVMLAEAHGTAVGMLVFFPIYSSWQGRPGVMIHDLFVREAGRGRGVGKALVRALAAIAVARGCTRMDVNVLDWNDRALGFYASLGLGPNDGWQGWRIEGAGLTALAAPDITRHPREGWGSCCG
jgi:GNAT superfamily N-acetyltransferase